MTTHTVPDHLSAIRDVAKAYGYTAIYDSGPGFNGKLVIFGDDEMAHDYLHGPGVLGKAIDVRINTRGEVERATLRIDGAIMTENTVLPDHGTPGERLIWAATIFIENPARVLERNTGA